MGSMKDLFGDMPYESASALARRTDPDTSHLAGRKIVPKLDGLRIKVLRCCASLGMFTNVDLDEWCVTHYGPRAESSYRKRCGELRDLGLVENSGELRFQRGSNRIVWRITASGRAELTKIGK
jgi:hypothetical protein